MSTNVQLYAFGLCPEHVTVIAEVCETRDLFSAAGALQAVCVGKQ